LVESGDVVLSDPTQQAPLLHEPASGTPALVVAGVLYAVGLAALYFAYAKFRFVEGAGGPRLMQTLLFPFLTQVGAVWSARRNRSLWAKAVWALVFAASAAALIGVSQLAMMGLSSVID